MQGTAQLYTLRNAFSLLKKRSLMLVQGKDAFKFLQGLTTNDLSILQHSSSRGTSLYANMLNVQGRVAFDVMISSPPSSPTTATTTTQGHSYWLDCSADVVTDIQQFLQKYLLRNKLTITDVSSSYGIWSVFGKDVTYAPIQNQAASSPSELALDPTEGVTPFPTNTITGKLQEWWGEKKDGACVLDPRYEKLGARVILPRQTNPQFPNGFTEVDESIYNLYRLQFGVGEGPQEIPRDSALPLEANTELLNGIHFHKGCYVGQELVARTHYSGLIRKRLFPFVALSQDYSGTNTHQNSEQLFSKVILDNLSAPLPAKGSTLSVGDPSSKGAVAAARDLKTGKVTAGVHNVGLALIRLESLNLHDLASTPAKDDEGRKVQILEPCWWQREAENIKKLVGRL